MPPFPYRELDPTPEAKTHFTQWIQQLDEQFTQHTSYERRSEIVREQLRKLFLPQGSAAAPANPLVELSLVLL